MFPPSQTRFIVQLAVFVLICIKHSRGVDNGGVQAPVEMMTDITNHLGFNLLYFHAIGNRNNIALSPCGLASVLVALFEGSDGPSAVQIHKVMELPWDRDLVRIGFRDIHRRLRSYFYSQENLLSGLSLSKENITIRPEYETILRFYGYDLENGGMMSSGKNEGGAEEAATETTTTENQTTTSSETTEPSTTSEIPITTTEEVESTTIENNTTTAVTESTTTTTTAASPSKVTISTKLETTTTKTEEPTTTETPNTTMYIFKFKPPKGDQSLATTDSSETTTEMEDGTTTLGLAENDLKRRRRRKQRTFTRNKRSPIQYVIADKDSMAHFNFNTGTPHPQYEISDYVVSEKFQLKSPDYNGNYQHEEVINHVFYLNHLETVNDVPYKVFNTIMRFGYLSTIKSSILEVELDNENYNMLILLPDYEHGLENLITTMKSHYVPTIREMRNSLQSTWVKAIVPKFFLKGHVILTGDLQNVGNTLIFY